MSTHGPVRMASSSELAFQVNANGSIRRIDRRDVIVNAFLGNEVEGGPTNLFLRRRGARIDWTPLLGPRSPGAVRLDERGLDVAGEWEGLRFRVSLRLAASAPAWFWHVAVENGGRRVETIDLLYTQDLALMDYGAVRLNEYYISQYVDHTPLVHSAHGVMLAARQNLSVGGRHPWALIGSLAKATRCSSTAWRRVRAARPWVSKPRACRARAASTSTRLRSSRTRHSGSIPTRAPPSASSAGSSPIILAQAGWAISHLPIAHSRSQKRPPRWRRIPRPASLRRQRCSAPARCSTSPSSTTPSCVRSSAESGARSSATAIACFLSSSAPTRTSCWRRRNASA